MFQFPGLSPADYVLAGQVVRHNAHRVSPFGDPRVKAYFQLAEDYRR